MGRPKLNRKPRLIKLSDEAWAKALRLVDREATPKDCPSYVIERLLLDAPETLEPRQSD